MKKVGVLTHYYDTVNYGGALQAYALCQAISALGLECEQISLDGGKDWRNLDRKPSPGETKLLKLFPQYRNFRRCLSRWKHRKQIREQELLLKPWREAFWDFNNRQIPHSEKVYRTCEIGDAVGRYDAFVVGSDQVWNPIWYYEPFFLTFAPSTVPKIAYAASISQKELSEKAKQTFADHLKDFRGISVREENAVDLLSDVVSQPVEFVLDPTLLLKKEQWEDLTAPKMMEKPYLFCYFLGNDSQMRELAKTFAREKGLTLVNIAHATAQYHETDLSFGDVQLEAPTPNEFLSWIRHAQFVFTDSFHASVFSLIFEREFFTFGRQGYKAMDSRMESLTKLFSVENRFCNTPERMTLAYLQGQSPIAFGQNRQEYEKMLKKSMDFLKRNLETGMTK